MHDLIFLDLIVNHENDEIVPFMMLCSSPISIQSSFYHSSFCTRKQKELLKKIRAKIKEQNQYEKQRRLELKLAERRRKMEEKVKRRQEREAAKGPRPTGLRQVSLYVYRQCICERYARA